MYERWKFPFRVSMHLLRLGVVVKEGGSRSSYTKSPLLTQAQHPGLLQAGAAFPSYSHLQAGQGFFCLHLIIIAVAGFISDAGQQ